MFCEHKLAGFAALVREFYANMVGKKQKKLAMLEENMSPSIGRLSTRHSTEGAERWFQIQKYAKRARLPGNSGVGNESKG